MILLAGLLAMAPPPPVVPLAPRGTATADRETPQLVGRVAQGGLVRGTAPAGTRLELDGVPLPIAPDGRFLIGFDRDAGPLATLVAALPDGRTATRLLSVAPGRWSIQSLPTLPKATPHTPEQIARRTAEVAQIAAARAPYRNGDGWRQAPLWPATGRISGVFGSQRIYAGEPGAYHAGVDIARSAGTPVVAPMDGIVVLAAIPVPFSLEGHLLMIDHGMGLVGAFLHLSRIDVAVGQRVVRGQRIGAVGRTGRATGPHLHWALTWSGRRIDPHAFAGRMPPG